MYIIIILVYTVDAGQLVCVIREDRTCRIWTKSIERRYVDELIIAERFRPSNPPFTNTFVASNESCVDNKNANDHTKTPINAFFQIFR